jgi:hypothetical protein
MNIEKDWITAAGLRAVIVATPMGHRCGYVGVPLGHVHYGKFYDDMPHEIEVHGGLTYSSNDNNYPVESDLYWFGYDCAHLGDKKDPALMSDRYKEVYSVMLDLLRMDEVVRDLPFCINECENLAIQLQGGSLP